MTLDPSTWAAIGFAAAILLLLTGMRMRVLDHYIGRMWVASFLIAALTMCGLYVVIDMARRFDAFLRTEGEPYVLIIYEYYSCRLPVYLSRLMPMICLAATIMTLVRLTKSNELVPMILSGRSVLRVLSPAILGMGLMMAGSMALEEWVLPAVSLQFRLTEARVGKTEVMAKTHLFERDGAGWFFNKYNKESRSMWDVMVDRTREDGRTWSARAERATWTEGTARGWMLTDGFEWTLDRWGRIDGKAKNFGKEGLLVPSTLSPDRIEESENPFLSISELASQVLAHPNDPTALVQFHTRLVFPLFNLILPALGLSVMLRREVRSLMLGFGICLVVGIAFFAVYLFFVNLGNKGGLDPVAAVWTPVVLFASASCWLMGGVRT